VSVAVAPSYTAPLLSTTVPLTLPVADTSEFDACA
jgi:hypothetical protein